MLLCVWLGIIFFYLYIYYYINFYHPHPPPSLYFNNNIINSSLDSVSSSFWLGKRSTSVRGLTSARWWVHCSLLYSKTIGLLPKSPLLHRYSLQYAHGSKMGPTRPILVLSLCVTEVTMSRVLSRTERMDLNIQRNSKKNTTS